MSSFIGLDIGGTKIAGVIFDQDNREIAQVVEHTPADYTQFVMVSKRIVAQLEQKGGTASSVGVGVPGFVDRASGIVPMAANTPCLSGHAVQKDLEAAFARPVFVANDADCAALSEATDGAGAGFHTVFGLILGTGVGGGYVVDGKIIEGPNGLTGEFGHLLLPFREPADGPLVSCVCRQHGCIDKSVSGPALSRLYKVMNGADMDASQIAVAAQAGDVKAQLVLDRFYTTVAKAMVTVLYTFDPEIIVVSGGLSNLPALTDAVLSRWSDYIPGKNIKTRFATAKHGAISGVRGAAWAGKKALQA